MKDIDEDETPSKKQRTETGIKTSAERAYVAKSPASQEKDKDTIIVDVNLISFFRLPLRKKTRTPS